MLKLEGLKLAPEEKEAALHRRAARLLRIPEEDVLSVQVLRRSIDAREELHLVYTVAAEVRQEKQVLRRCRDRRVSRFAPERYALPEVLSSPEVPPVVVGAGPGGLFAALVLARCGLRPILLERGRDTTARQRDVETFWRTGVLDPESNVQFGEGGAGAFSDGKLNTGTKDLRHRWILEELVHCGAPESILTDAKPHVGTDMLHIALQNLRQELLSLGAQVRFGHRLEGLESRDGVLTGLHVRTGEGTYRLPVRAVVLAPGHSARDTFQMLYEAGVPMEAKPFAVGVRIEHRQRDMDAAQYRQYAGHPCLPASTYKLSCHTAAGCWWASHRRISARLTLWRGWRGSGSWRRRPSGWEAADSWLPASGWRTFWPTAPPRGRERCCPAIAPASRGATSMTVCRRSSRRPWRRRCPCWSGSSGAMPSRMPF